MQTHYDDLDVFCAVVNTGSFYKASQLLGMPHSTVSRRIASLEESLNEKLIERTTRQMHVTEKGQMLFNRCEPLFQELKAAISDTLDDEIELKGPFKITMPTRVGLDYMGKILIQFNRLYPKMELEIQLENSFSDLVAENIDLALRVGPLADSSAIAVTLMEIPFALVAHPRTIEQFDIDPDNFDLKRLDAIPCATAAPQSTWEFKDKDHGRVIITPNAVLKANDLSLVIDAAMHTKVITYVPCLTLQLMNESHQLVGLKGSNWSPQVRTLYGVYTPSRRTSRKVRAVIDFTRQMLAEQFSQINQP